MISRKGKSSADPEAAHRSTDNNQASAAVIIPAGFTQSIIPAEGTMSPVLAPDASVDQNSVQPKPVQIEVYTNPFNSTSAGGAKTIVEEFVLRVDEGPTSSMTSIVQLMLNGLLNLLNAKDEARD